MLSIVLLRKTLVESKFKSSQAVRASIHGMIRIGRKFQNGVRSRIHVWTESLVTIICSRTSIVSPAHKPDDHKSSDLSGDDRSQRTTRASWNLGWFSIDVPSCPFLVSSRVVCIELRTMRSSRKCQSVLVRLLNSSNLNAI